MFWSSPVRPPFAPPSKLPGTVPIVMITNQDPVAIGLVESLARPGGNLTGVVSLTRDLQRKAARTPKGSCAEDIARWSDLGKSYQFQERPMLSNIMNRPQAPLR